MSKPSNAKRPAQREDPVSSRLTVRRYRVSDVCRALEGLAPPHLAQEWDNVGLLAGDMQAAVRRVLLCIDLTAAVIEEAAERRVQFIMAYHPPLFKPVTRLTAPSDNTSSLVFRCIEAGLAVFSVHTALDAAEGGTNDCLARLCGLTRTEPIEYVDGTEGCDCKVVVFVPATSVDIVGEAMFQAGAGRIGDYDRCSFRIPGAGTFRGGESTHPTIGVAGCFETVSEIRLEALTPRRALPAVIDAIRRTHPYEEPAFDVYPLHAVPQRGIGRHGELPRATRLGALARRLKKGTGAGYTHVVGDPARPVHRAVICVGSAGSLPFKLPLGERDVIVTGEIRHHDALRINRAGCSAIALGHWSSERPALPPLAEALADRLATLEVLVSEADRDPFISL